MVFHAPGVRTTCFISPIFPGITGVKAILERAKEQCNLIWLENLNLRGSCRAVIMDYIKEKYPALLPLYLLLILVLMIFAHEKMLKKVK